MTGAEGRTATFADGTTSEVDGVLWATGYRTDHSWIDVPGIRDDSGRILHERGVTPVAGLYMLGLSWQYKRTSALLGWVTQDAEFIVGHIEA
jgi:putative flavoprotein involved in K+ transport